MAENWYRAYGLVIRSETELPEFLPAAPAPHDITVGFSPEAAAQWAASGAGETDAYGFVAAPAGGCVMHVPGICDYWVREGRELLLAPAPDSDPVSVRLFLLGSAIGMVFHQRGMLVMHGATVLHGRGATIFVGESGQGKSTLAAYFGRAGHGILGDDTMPLWPRAGGGFEVWPGSRMFKLWSDTIDALGESPDALNSVGVRLDKFFYPNVEQPPDRPAPLFEIVELVARDAGAAPELEPLGGLEALRVIAANTYRTEYLPLLGREADHFRLCSELADSVPVSRLSRPWTMARIDESLALIRNRWTGAGRVAGRAL